jgi:hypothetical protein
VQVNEGPALPPPVRTITWICPVPGGAVAVHRVGPREECRPGTGRSRTAGSCRNQRLLDVARSLRQEGELYRQWSVSLDNEPGRTARLLISCATDHPNETE